MASSMPALRTLARSFSAAAASAEGGRKVAVLGAAGGIGQPLSMLMKMNQHVSEVSLFDIAGTPGVAADISHINTTAIAKGYMGDEQLHEALTGCDLVIIPAGVPRKPGMTRDDLFKINAGIVAGLVTACAKACPNALINMISNPVNSTVPIFSQATPSSSLSDDVIDALTKRTQDGGTEVVEAKQGKGSATLSMAYAGALMGDACLQGLAGKPNVVECSYVESPVLAADGIPYFSTKVELGPGGVSDIRGIGEITAYEQDWLDKMKPELAASIQKGVDFAKAM